MNQKELNEIRRRIKPERNNIQRIYGCYVNGGKEIISYIDESVGLLSKEESEKYFSILKKSLSGALGKNLIDICFETKQVIEGEEHKLLSALRNSSLDDEEKREEFYQKVIQNLDMEDSNYLILLACDTYDVPHKAKDGERADSADVFKYILCAVCPVKSGKAELGYKADDMRFHSESVNQIVSSPEIGFMFPCFDDRCANIYNALFYSKNTMDIHKEFIDAVFHTEPPMSPGVQRETFGAVLAESLDEKCPFDTVQAVHEQLSERISLHKESKDPEPLVISPEEMDSILENSGMNSEQIESFNENCGREFGKDAVLCPANIIDSKKLEICTPQVKLSVDPKFAYLVETKVIDGKKCIVIDADAGVELNGISVEIQ